MQKVDRIVKYAFMAFVVIACIYAYNAYEKHQKSLEIQQLKESIQQEQNDIDVLESAKSILGN
jgi:hypothetical protein